MTNPPEVMLLARANAFTGCGTGLANAGVAMIAVTMAVSTITETMRAIRNRSR